MSSPEEKLKKELRQKLELILLMVDKKSGDQKIIKQIETDLKKLSGKLSKGQLNTLTWKYQNKTTEQILRNERRKSGYEPIAKAPTQDSRRKSVSLEDALPTAKTAKNKKRESGFEWVVKDSPVAEAKKDPRRISGYEGKAWPATKSANDKKRESGFEWIAKDSKATETKKDPRRVSGYEGKERPAEKTSKNPKQPSESSESKFSNLKKRTSGFIDRLSKKLGKADPVEGPSPKKPRG